jgi:hypothetical protein
MSFFYNLNDKLNAIRATPEVTHKQLNERDLKSASTSALKAAVGKDREADKKSGVLANYSTKQVKDELRTRDVEEGMSRAAKGYEKYGKEGMEALARAGREGKALDPVRAKYDKYDNTEVDEGAHSQHAMDLNPDFAKTGQKPGVMDRVARGAKKLADFVAPGDEELLDRLQRSSGARQPGGPRQPVKEKMSPGKAKSFAALAPPTDKITFADKIAGAKKEVDEMLGDVAAEAMKKALGGGRGREQEMDEAAGSIDYDKVLEAIAALYGDDIYDNDAMQDLANDLEQAGPTDRELDFIIAKGKLPKRLAGIQFSAGDSVQFDEASTGNAFDYKNFKQPEKQKPTSFVHKGTYGTEYDGDKEDAQAIRTKKQAAAAAGQGSRGRGRPKKGASVDTGEVMKPDFSAFGDKVKIKPFAGKITKHKMVGEDDLDPKDQGEYDQEGDMAKDSIKTVVRHAQALEKILGDDDNLPEWVQSKLAKIESMMTAVDDYMQNQTDDMDDEQEPIAEKAVSKKQQRFMGMVSAAKKGEKPASKEVAKVAKTMKKGDAEDFASTKHKGLPEKAAKKPKEKDVEESTTSGSVATSAAAPKASKASGGFTFGKGIYDSMNRELEGMIAESMSMNMSMNNDGNGPTRSLTITATDDDATRLAQLLKSAGLGGSDHDYHTMDENYGVNEVSQNTPDYPTNTETAEDNFEYSGGLNKPKSTGQTTVPVIASQDERQESYAAEEEDAIKRMMEMAGMSAAGGASAGDYIDYVSASGEQPPEDLIMQNGVEYDPDTNVISVRNATSLANTHRAITAAGWKKQAAGARPNPAVAGQAMQAGDTAYQLGEQDAIDRMMEMAGVKKKAVEEEKTEEGNLFTKGLADDNVKVGDKIPGTNATKTKDIDESIFALTNQWRAYKG